GAIVVQRIGSVNGRAQSAAGTIIVRGSLPSAHRAAARLTRSLSALLAFRLENSHARYAEAEVLSRLNIGGHHNAGLVRHRLKLLRISRRECHAWRRHHYE